MKKSLIAIAMLVASVGAFAQADASNQTSVQSGAVAGATNAGNAQNITFTSPADQTTHVQYGGSYTVKNVPSVSGPNLASSNDTCMGSTSGSLNFAGFGGGLGSTWVDDNCKMLKNSRELWNMGMKAASLALMCTDGANKAALELTGFVCPQTAKEQAAAKASGTVAAKPGETTDPYVRARMGLAPLAVAK